jgi:hypothetical protein
MKMKRETAELIVNSFEQAFRFIGLAVFRPTSDPGEALTIRMMPRAMRRMFEYDREERESLIKYLMANVAEPTAGERKDLANLPTQLPRVLRQAFSGPPPFKSPDYGSRNYRTKISRDERAEVRKEVEGRMKRSVSYAQAIREVAETYGVHTRTIRRLCPRAE